MGAHYPGAEFVPWQYRPEAPSYYAGQNAPIAAVLHIAEGWESTVRSWAASGFNGASFHYFVCRDGRVLQLMEHEDGGYQAGVPRIRASGRPQPDPTWPLWRGWGGGNINNYTLGIEHEGFTGTPFTPEQAAGSKALCRWLANEFGWPMDRDHFPAHAVIDVVDRTQDFNSPELREEHYSYLLSAAPPAPFVPKPGEKPIPFNREQMAALQSALFRGAWVGPQRYVTSTVELKVDPGYSVEAGVWAGPGVIPIGTVLAEYKIYVAVPENAMRAP